MRQFIDKDSFDAGVNEKNRDDARPPGSPCCIAFPPHPHTLRTGKWLGEIAPGFFTCELVVHDQYGFPILPTICAVSVPIPEELREAVDDWKIGAESPEEEEALEDMILKSEQANALYSSAVMEEPKEVEIAQKIEAKLCAKE